jgi:AraC-like DNA-binding protein
MHPHETSEFRSWKVAGLSGVEFLWDRDPSNFPEHIHEGFNIDYVQAGLLEYRIGVRSFLVRPGNFVWINQHTVHSARSFGEGLVVIKSIFISENFVLALASELGIKQNDLVIDPIIYNGELAEQIAFIHETAKKSCDALEVETRLLEVIFSLLSRSSRIRTSMQQSPCEHQAVNKIKEYLLAHYAENVSLGCLADLVELNRFYLVRVFRDHVGLPPYSYLVQIRMAKARNLLLRGIPPAEVAAAVGFSDQSHLTRVFKRATGKTPGSFTHKDRKSGKEILPLW